MCNNEFIREQKLNEININIKLGRMTFVSKQTNIKETPPNKPLCYNNENDSQNKTTTLTTLQYESWEIKDNTKTYQHFIIFI